MLRRRPSNRSFYPLLFLSERVSLSSLLNLPQSSSDGSFRHSSSSQSFVTTIYMLSCSLQRSKPQSKPEEPMTKTQQQHFKWFGERHPPIIKKWKEILCGNEASDSLEYLYHFLRMVFNIDDSTGRPTIETMLSMIGNKISERLGTKSSSLSSPPDAETIIKHLSSQNEYKEVLVTMMRWMGSSESVYFVPPTTKTKQSSSSSFVTGG